MNVFDVEDYKALVNGWIAEQPKGGYGQLQKLATAIQVNSVVMSQVFRGPRHLTLEQGVRVAKYLSLTELERDFFLLLLNAGRAGTKELASVYKQQINAARASARALQKRIKHTTMTAEDCATFYADWYHSAVRLSTSIDRLNTAGQIAGELGVDALLVADSIAFLLQHGLITKHRGGLAIGPSVTHVGHDSPFVARHHTNWRLKGLQAMERRSEDDLFYTGPMALSRETARHIRARLVGLVEEVTKSAVKSSSETVACLGIDWFQVSK